MAQLEYQNYCEHCERISVAYDLKLTKGHVEGFKKFADKYFKRGREGLKKGEIGLTNSQYGNFQNIRHYGIAKQSEGQYWHLTKKGELFYFGQISLVTPVLHMDKKTLPDDHPAWDTYTGKKQIKHITDYFPEHYRKREEFAAIKNKAYGDNFSLF